jgi:hypothetical protein
MKSTLTVLCAGVALSWVALVGAQGYGQSSSEQSSKSKASQDVKLVGCLAEGTSPDTFVLNNVENQTAGMEHPKSEQTGTSGQEPSSQASMTVQLVAGKNVDLKKHIGHKVEIRGTMEPMDNQSSMSGQGTGEASGMSGTQGTSGSQAGSSMSGGSMSQESSAPTHRVMVKSIKHLGSSCQ